MHSIQGEIFEITYTHPTLGSGRFKVKAGESSTLDLGGIMNEDDPANITTSGELIINKKRVAGSLEVSCVNDMTGADDLALAREIQASPALATWTISTADGSVLQGAGYIGGDLQVDASTGVFTLKLLVSRWEKI